jgi:hypothetical protein
VRWGSGRSARNRRESVVGVMDVWSVILVFGVSGIWLCLAGAFVVLVRAKARA